MRICRAPDCENTAINQRTVCTKHKHRLRKSGTFEITGRIKKAVSDDESIVKVCDIHGELTRDMVYQQYSIHKNKKYPYFQCKNCVSDKRKRLYYANHEKSKEYALSQRKKHYEKCIERDRKYKRQLLIDESKYNELHEKQKGLCAICNKPETRKSHKNRTKPECPSDYTIKRLAIDHNHLNGQVRGLLCGSCNTALGGFKDSIDVLKSAIIYLHSFEN